MRARRRPPHTPRRAWPEAGRRLLGAWMRLVVAGAVPIVVLALLLTGVAAWTTVTRIGVNTETTDMLSEELPFRRDDRAIKAAFPQWVDVISIVVEGATPEQADAAAARLAADLAPRTDRFRSVFYAPGDPFFRRNGLLFLPLDALQRLSDRLAEVQPLLAALSRDPSLRGLGRVLTQALEAARAPGAPQAGLRETLAPTLGRMAAAVESVAASREGRGTIQPLSWSRLTGAPAAEAEADRRRFILVQPVLDFASFEPAAAAIETVRARAAALGLDAADGVRVRLTGTPVMFQEELRSVSAGMGVAGALSAALVTLLLTLGLRSARLVGAAVATLLAGLVWTAGFAAVAVGELNLISVAFAVLFIGLSVDFGIHFALRYQEALDGGAREPRAALLEAAHSVGGPLTLCAVAAAAGFFAFFPTSYRGLSELGLISGVGMFIALFANLTLLPALLSLFPSRPRPSAARRSPSAAAFAAFAAVAARPRPILAGALVLALAALAAVPFARFDDDPLGLRDPSSESVATLHDLIDDPRVQPYEASFLADDLAEAEALAARLEALPEVDAAVTLADFVPRDQAAKLDVLAETSFFLGPVLTPTAAVPAPTVAEQRAAVAALRRQLDQAGGALAPQARRLAKALDRVRLDGPGIAALEAALVGGLPGRLTRLRAALEAEPVTAADVPRPLVERYRARDGRALVEVRPSGDLRDADARRRFVDAVRSVREDATGSAVIITEAGRAVLRAFFEAAALAIVAITLLLLAVLRSVRDAGLVLMPLFLAALLTVAATVALSLPFNFANVIVLPLLFGLGVASGIHIVMRARRRGTWDVMTTSTPRAVLLSALTTIASFASLALSSHRGTASMGLLLAVAITLTLLSTLVVLPALLRVFGVTRSRRQG